MSAANTKKMEASRCLDNLHGLIANSLHYQAHHRGRDLQIDMGLAGKNNKVPDANLFCEYVQTLKGHEGPLRVAKVKGVKCRTDVAYNNSDMRSEKSPVIGIPTTPRVD